MTAGEDQFVGSSESGGQPVVLAALAQIRELATMVQGSPAWQLGDTDTRLAVKEAAVAARQLESAYLGLVYELDQRPGVVKGARAGFQARTFIRHALNQTTAHAKDDVAAAYALRPDADPAKGGLPRLGAAFAAGEVSRDHVNAAVRAAARIPKPLLSAPAADTSAADSDADSDADSAADSAADCGDDPATAPAADTGADAGDCADQAAAADQATAGADEVSPDDLAAGPGDADPSADGGDASAAAGGDAPPADAGTGAAAGGGWGVFRCGGDVVDEVFTRHARDYDPAATARLARALLEGLDPDAASSFDPDACLKRNLRLIQDGEGMWLLNGVLDPASGALLKALLDHLSTPHPSRTETADDGTLVDVEDTRTAGQRNADALMELVRQGQAGNLGTRGGEPPRITIITGASDLAAARAARAARAAGSSTHPVPGHHPEAGTRPASGTSCPDEDSGTRRPEACRASEHEASGEDDETGHAGQVDPGEPGEPGDPVDAGDPGEEIRRWINPWTTPPTRMRHDTSSGCAGGCPSGRADDPGQGGRLATGERIDPQLLARLSCDSILHTVLLAPSGAILDQGRETRTVTPAQRRALTARDQGCTIPGCTAPAHWCEGHHVQYWRDDGPTDIANLALVCARHHTEIHLGIWTLTMHDGIPWVTPPQWLDPSQTALRNTYFTDLATTRRTGTQLRLNLDNDDG